MAWIVNFAVIAVLAGIGFLGFALTTPKISDAYFGKTNSLILKGFAILCILLCHSMGIWGHGVTLFTPLGGIGVSVFLFLSGYGLNESYAKSTYTAWWRKRIATVLIPYSIVQILLYWTVHDFTLPGFILDILCISSKYKFGWYLTFLFLLYLLFYVIKRIPFTAKHTSECFLLVSVALFFVFPAMQAEQSFSFLLGIVLSEKKDVFQKRINWKTGIAALLFGIIFLAVKQTTVVRAGSELLYKLIELLIKLPCGFGFSCIIISVGKKVNLSFFAWLGTISFEIYILHGYFIDLFPKNAFGEVIFLAVTILSATVLRLIWAHVKKPLWKLLKIQK